MLCRNPLLEVPKNATAARLYAEAARKAPDLAERDRLTRQAARLSARRGR